MRRVLAALTVVAALAAPATVASVHAATAPPSAAAAAAARTAPPTLQFGDQGQAVRILQHALRVPKVHAQGFFNRKTQRAVKAFQLRMGLRTTGVVTAPTWAALGPRVSRAAARTVAMAPSDVLPWESFAARDLVGYRTSTYQGKYFDGRFEQYRLCVVQRESGGRYGASSGSHLGAYQFSYSLAAQALRAMRAEMGAEFGNAGLAFLDRLSGDPMSTWPRYAQDAAFWTIFNRGAGWSHWSSRWGANWNCDHRPNQESGWPSAGALNYLPFEG
jgi:peptidoglycan hydrolase-like protein with peptidoglycan-binding domain